MRFFKFFIIITNLSFAFELSLDKGFIIEGKNNITSSIPCYFNGDDKPGIALGVPDDNKVYIFSYNEKGTRSIDSADYRILGGDNEKIGFSLACGDVIDYENKNKKDLIIGCPYAGTGGKVYVVECPINQKEVNLKLGEGKEISSEIQNEGFGYSIAIGKINDDELDDMVISSSNKIYLFHGDSIKPKKILELQGGTSIAIGDINGDKFNEIITSLDDKIIIYWGSSTNEGIYGSSSISGKGSLACSDINNDGFSDLIVANENSYIILGTNTNFGSLTISLNYKGEKVEVADIDGDGFNEIIIKGTDTCLFFEKASLIGSVTITTGGISKGKIDNDMDDDIIISSNNKAYCLYEPFYIRGTATKGTTIEIKELKATQTTYENGGFFFKYLLEGTYTLIPKKDFYVFDPSSYTTFLSISIDDISFSETHLYIEGSITEDLIPIPGATITIKNKETRTTTSDSSGSYFIEVPEEGTYTIEVKKDFYVFLEATKTISIDKYNTPVRKDFYGMRMFIMGSVTTKQGTPTGGATLTVSNIGEITIPDTGSYYFDVSSPGEYKISIEKQGFAFDYQEKTFTIDYDNPKIIHNIMEASLSLYGTISLEGKPFSSVTIFLSGCASSTTTSNENGYYAFNILNSGSYKIKPYKEYYGFSPKEEELTIDFYNPNPIVEFEASLLFLKGSVTKESNEPIENATITIKGDYETITTTDSSGSYYILLPKAGSYTITPSKEKYKFRPPNLTIELYCGNVIDFKGGIPPTITSITPNKGENEGTISINIIGEDLKTETKASLLMGTITISGSFTSLEEGTIGFIFDLEGKKEGTYSLVLTNDKYYSSTLTDCFFISSKVFYIKIYPSSTYLSDLENATFTASSFDKWDRHLERIYNWEITPSIGTISQDIGTFTIFTSGTIGTKGYIWAKSEQASETATIHILGASRLEIEIDGTKTAGEIFTLNIKGLNKSNNLALSYNSKIMVLGSEVNILNGIGSLSLSFQTSGTKTITAYDINHPSICGTKTIFIEPSSPSKIYLYALGSVSCDAGTIAIFAYVVDKFGNPVADGSIVDWSLEEGTGSLGSNSSKTKDGTATIILSSRKAEEKTIRANCNDNTDVIKIRFIEGETKILHLTLKEGLFAGDNFVFELMAYDKFSNYTPLFISSATFTYSPSTYTIKGSLTFSLCFEVSGTYTGTITTGSISTSITFLVKPLSLNSLIINCSQPIVGSYFDIDIFSYDKFKNPIDVGYISIYDTLKALTYTKTSDFNGILTKYKGMITKMGSDTITFNAGSIVKEISLYVLGSQCLESKLISKIGTITIKENSFDNPYRIDIEKYTGTITLPRGNIGFGFSITSDIKPLSSSIITIEMPYNDIDNNNIVDGTNIYKQTLRLYVYDNGWKEILSMSYPDKNILIGTTNHLSLFAPAGDSGASHHLKKVPVFPNPYYAWEKDKHKGKITFGDKSSPLNSEKRLPSPITIRIFNVAGELILEKENIQTSGYWEWEVGDTASGVYFYQLKKGKDEVFGKIGIVK